jgi:hypothetical protein
MDEYENESFSPVIKESELLNQKITTLFKATDDIDNDITLIANKGKFDLLLIGIGQSIFEGSLLGRILGYTTRIVNPDRIIQRVARKEKVFSNSPFDDRTQNILLGSKIPVGIYIDKNSGELNQIIVALYTENDEFLLDYIQLFIKNSNVRVLLSDSEKLISSSSDILENIQTIDQEFPEYLTIAEEAKIDEKVIQQYQLMVISTDGWKKLLDSQISWIEKTPSILVLKA